MLVMDETGNRKKGKTTDYVTRPMWLDSTWATWARLRTALCLSMRMVLPSK